MGVPIFGQISPNWHIGPPWAVCVKQQPNPAHKAAGSVHIPDPGITSETLAAAQRKPQGFAQLRRGS